VAPVLARRRAELETRILRLNLQHTWTTTMSSSQYRDTLHLAYARDGITGYGEGAPIVRYHEDAESARQAGESVRARCFRRPHAVRQGDGGGFRRVPGEWRAKAAIDIALMDWVGQRLGIPLYTYFGLDPKDAPLTTFQSASTRPKSPDRRPRKPPISPS